MSELGKYYNLDECSDRTKIINKLNKLKKDGKIEYNINQDILKLDDIDLEDRDIHILIKLFDDCDMFEETEMDDDNYSYYYNDDDDEVY